MYCWHFTLYGVFQMALILAVIIFLFSSPLFAQIEGPIDGTQFPTTFQLNPGVQANYAIKYALEKIGYSCSFVKRDEGTDAEVTVLEVDNKTILSLNNGGDSSTYRATFIYYWVSGGELQGIESGTEYQLCLQVVLCVKACDSTGAMASSATPFYVVCWFNLKLLSADSSSGSFTVSSNPMSDTYSLPIYFTTSGVKIYPNKKPAYPINVFNIIGVNPGKQYLHFQWVFTGWSYSPQNNGSPNSKCQIVQTTNSSYRNFSWYITANTILWGIPNSVTNEALSWPNLKYFGDAASDSYGVIYPRAYQTSFDYDSGGQYDLSEWMVGKNRNDPSDDDTEQNPDPQVQPPKTEWEEGQTTVDIGKKTAEGYSKFWKEETGSYAPAYIGSVDTTVVTESMSPFDGYVDAEPLPDIISKSQTVESQFQGALDKQQIYQDLKSLIAPLSSSSPYKYDFSVSFELPDVTQAPSAASPSSSGSTPGQVLDGVSGTTWSPHPPQTINLGNFSFDMSIFYENQTVYNTIRIIRSIINFMSSLSVFFRIYRMFTSAILGGSVTGALFGVIF